MANDTGAFGLQPIGMDDGSSYVGSLEKVYISASYATALYVGTPVLLTPTLAEKEATSRYQTVNIAVATSGVYYGVIVSFEPNPDNLSLQYSPASTEGYAYIVKGPDVVFRVRGDGSGAPTAVLPGQNAAMVATAAGSTATGLSGWHLDETTPTTTAGLPLQIIGIEDKADNVMGDNAIYRVKLNTTGLAAGDRLGITAT